MPYSVTNFPGIVTSEYKWIIDGQYSNQGQNQTFELNLTGVTATQFQNYGLTINGSLVTFIYTGTGGLADLVSQLANYLNGFGFFWATVLNLTTIRLVARVVGTNYTIDKGLNLTAATVTQTLPGLSPVPLTPGTLLFFDIRKDTLVQSTNDHRFVTTYDQVSGVAGFNLARHVAGVLVAEESNDGVNESITRSNVRLLRSGIITYRNYGTLANRTMTLAMNNSTPTLSLPGGALGVGLNQSLGALADRILPYAYTLSGQVGSLLVSL